MSKLSRSATLIFLLAGCALALAQTTISALPAGSALAGTEAFPGDQSGGCSGNTCKFTPNQIRTYIIGSANGILQANGSSVVSAVADADPVVALFGVFSPCVSGPHVQYLDASGGCSYPTTTASQLVAYYTGFAPGTTGTTDVSMISNLQAGLTPHFIVTHVYAVRSSSANVSSGSTPHIAIWTATGHTGTEVDFATATTANLINVPQSSAWDDNAITAQLAVSGHAPISPVIPSGQLYLSMSASGTFGSVTYDVYVFGAQLP